MPDVTREEFLRSLRLVRDAEGNVSLYGGDGDHVAQVRGNLGVGLSAYQIGSWIVEACQRAARTCATCLYALLPHEDGTFECQWWGDGMDRVEPGDFCCHWQDGETADAESV